MNAVTVAETAQVNIDRCIGCGLCVTDCPTGAMSLQEKPESQRYVPPANVMETYINIARERGKI
jgi:Fe-S-cluster-containing hydrogenase component 2